MTARKTCAVLLAAVEPGQQGGGWDRALYQLLFRPLIRWVYDNCTDAGIGDICVTTGSAPDDLQRELPEGVSIVQKAAGVAAFLAEHRDADVLVASGDAPFLFPDTIRGALAFHREKGNAATIIAAPWKNPAVGEEQLYDTRARWFTGESLLAALEKAPFREGMTPGEITAAVREEAGAADSCWLCPDFRAALRAGDRQQLALLSQFAREMVFEDLYSREVDIPATDGVIIDPRAQIGPSTQILPGTVIKGTAVVGKDAVIGPNSWLEDCTVGDRCVVNATYVLDSVLEDGVEIGPFTRVRPGSRLGAGVKIGNFVEVKNATVGPGTKSAHLTYIGDADVGARVNFGCGVCIANYDGVQKHRTTIGDDCFIGCNTNLVAPVTLGDGAYTAAGTTITEDVPADALSIGRARQVNLPERAKEHQKHPRAETK